ncbi:MAG: hypothetical protein R6V78_17275, partial [Desulfosarcina sp.]
MIGWLVVGIATFSLWGVKFKDVVQLLFVQAQGFFHKHVLGRLECFFYETGVRIVACGDKYGVYVIAVQNVRFVGLQEQTRKSETTSISSLLLKGIFLCGFNLIKTCICKCKANISIKIRLTLRAVALLAKIILLIC